jgi:isopropylmalate/homocitrate/citramalate synthase
MGDLPGRISLREVGPRDGLQNEDPVPTEAKVELIDALSLTGVDLEALIDVAARAEHLVGHTLPSQVLRAGPRSRTISL